MLSLTQYLHHKQFPKFLIIFLLLGISLLLIILKTRSLSSDQIIPGKTDTKSFLKQNIPFKTITEPEKTEYYVGDSTGRNNSTYVEKNGIIEYYLERNPSKFVHPDYQGYIDEFGQPDLTRYNDWYTYAKFEVHVFLKSGLAVTVQPDSKKIIEEWHFTKGLSPELFDANYKNLFSSTPPAPSNQF